MERLTRAEIGETTGAVLYNHSDSECNDSCMYGTCGWNTRALERLKEYEDTGLSPQEINHYVAIHKEIWEEKLASITNGRDFWESEAKKWCDQAFEYRLRLEGGK